MEKNKKEITIEDVERIERTLGKSSTPKGIEARIRPRMYLGHIKYLIKPEYIKKGCYLVYGNYHIQGNIVKFKPSYYSPLATHMVWFFTYRSGLFMIRESDKEQPVAIVWKLIIDSKRNIPCGANHIVVGIIKYKYSDALEIVNKYAVYKKQLECFWQHYSWMEPSCMGRPFKTGERLEDRIYLE